MARRMMKKKPLKEVITARTGGNRAPRKVRPVSKAVRSYVNRAIGARAENKTPTGVYASGNPILSMTSTTWGSLVNCSSIWNVVNGTGQGNRIGNAIRPIRWTLKGYINNNGNTATNTMVKMYVFKALAGFADPSVLYTNPSNFYQLGNSTAAPTNSFLDLMRVPNKDLYKVYATRILKIGPALSSSGSNNDFKTVGAFSFDLLKYQKHIIKYNDGTVGPSNSGLYIAFVLIDPLGGQNITPNGPEIAYDIEGEFEDA